MRKTRRTNSKKKRAVKRRPLPDLTGHPETDAMTAITEGEDDLREGRTEHL